MHANIKLIKKTKLNFSLSILIINISDFIYIQHILIFCYFGPKKQQQHNKRIDTFLENQLIIYLNCL